mgnify:CR=1 FL=1
MTDATGQDGKRTVSEGTLDEAEWYLMGLCPAFAVALARRAGWDLAVLADETVRHDPEGRFPTAFHAVAVSPDGMFWDARGNHAHADLAAEQDRDPGPRARILRMSDENELLDQWCGPDGPLQTVDGNHIADADAFLDLAFPGIFGQSVERAGTFDAPSERSERSLYHVCPAERVEDILSEGLRPREGEAGVYLWDTLRFARWFRDLHAEDGRAMAVLAVDGNDLTLERDPETADMREWSSRFEDGKDGGGWISADPVSRDRLRVVEAPETVPSPALG